MDPDTAVVVGKYIGAALACTVVISLPVTLIILLVRYFQAPTVLLPIARLPFWPFMLVFGAVAFVVWLLLLAV